MEDRRTTRLMRISALRSSPLHIARAMALTALLLTTACSKEGSGPVIVSVAGTRSELMEPLRNPLSPASKLILEATGQGLVAFDAQGDIVPALAQRWIVEDGGLSYIFRIRRAQWPDGSRVEAKEVARLLALRIEANRVLDPLGDLDAVREVIPMTGEVIEVRMATPRPYFLQMLAQPQMAITRIGGGTGPYRMEDRKTALFLTPITDPAAEEDELKPRAWENRVLRAERPAKAIVRFRMGLSDLVLGGRFSSLPLLTKAGAEPQAVRIDPVQGLFGFAITGQDDFFGAAPIRAALSMAVDRDRLPAAFDIGGWTIQSGLLPGQFDLPGAPVAPSWQSLSMDDRRARAIGAVNGWRAAHDGKVPILRIALPAGPGSRTLFNMIAADFLRIGLSSRLVPLDDDADLRLVDEVAAYDSALWYLGRVGCARKIRCNEAAEEKLQEAGLADTDDARTQRLAEAQALLAEDSGFIPLASPIRWSLVSKRLTGFQPSRRARHPLNRLFRTTT